MSVCRDTIRAIDAYVDGELAPSHVLDVEQHVAECSACLERVELARAMKRAVRGESLSMGAPASLRARIAISAASERAAEAEDARPSRAPSWRSALPWAAAAAVAIAVGGGVHAIGGQRGTAAAPKSELLASAASLNLIEDLAGPHAQPLPPEELDPVRIARVFSPIVGVPVRPVHLHQSRHGSFSFTGARLLNVQHEPAASLTYNAGDRRVTVVVFDPQRMPKPSCCLSRRTINAGGEERTVFVGRAKGYALAVYERDGVGYAVSSDLGENEVLAMAADL
jgi:mycothiol system anti-sigma-R factor